MVFTAKISNPSKLFVIIIWNCQNLECHWNLIFKFQFECRKHHIAAILVVAVYVHMYIDLFGFWYGCCSDQCNKISLDIDTGSSNTRKWQYKVNFLGNIIFWRKFLPQNFLLFYKISCNFLVKFRTKAIFSSSLFFLDLVY